MNRRARTAKSSRRRALFTNPFAWGEPIELLYYIPPTKKGDVDEGIAGANLSVTKNPIGSPHEEGSIETPTVRSSPGVHHV